MNLIEPIIAEFHQEMATTRKMLERVPGEHLSWKPHEKSRSLGEIAQHVANLPGVFIVPLDGNAFDKNQHKTSEIRTAAAILDTFDRNVAGARETLKGLSDEWLLSQWSYKYGEKVIFSMPRLAVLRAMGINHIIHHRGQLSVYLRLLNVPLPPVYGPTADEV